jgi:hypothetical protein
VSKLDPNYLTPDFALASRGYQTVRSGDLADYVEDLPPARTRREMAIVAALRHGIAHPAEWDRVHRPMVLSRRPGAGLPEWRET